MGQLTSNLKKTVIVLTAILFIFDGDIFGSFNNPLEWYSKLKQLKPLITHKKEVEQLFGQPEVISSIDSGELTEVTYRIKEGKLLIKYSAFEKCSETNKRRFNVERGVVFIAQVFLKKGVSIRKFGLNLSKFEKRQTDLMGYYSYRSHELGEAYLGTPKEIVEVILHHTTEQDKKLGCENLCANYCPLISVSKTPLFETVKTE